MSKQQPADQPEMFETSADLTLNPDRQRALAACAARFVWCIGTDPDDDHGGACHVLNSTRTDVRQTPRTRPVGRADTDVVERSWSYAR